MIAFESCRQPGGRLLGISLRILTAVVVVAVAGLSPSIAKADSVNLGVVSFDELNPGATNAFTIYNFTGVNSLPPDFSVASDLTFLSPTLTLTDGSGSTANSLADLSSADGASQFEVLASDGFLQAVFQTTLSQTTFGLSDGTTFQADSDVATVTLLPSSLPDLIAGTDFAIITVSGSIVTAPAPESPTWVLLWMAMLCLLAWKHARRQSCS